MTNFNLRKFVSDVVLAGYPLSALNDFIKVVEGRESERLISDKADSVPMALAMMLMSMKDGAMRSKMTDIERNAVADLIVPLLLSYVGDEVYTIAFSIVDTDATGEFIIEPSRDRQNIRVSIKTTGWF